MYVCICKGITEARVRELLAERVSSADELIAVLGLDDPGCCGRCRRSIRAACADQTPDPADTRRCAWTGLGAALSELAPSETA